MKKLSLEKIACVVVMFCAVGGVAAFAQTFSTVASFDGTNGAYPLFGTLVQGTNGNFYGTTAYGGANSGGTIYEVTSAGVVTTLYSFCAKTNCRDGQVPASGLAQTANGDFYGTTNAGGANANGGCGNLEERCGTVFEISPEGKLTTLYSFCAQTNSEGHCTDGAQPYGTLVQGYDGDFYGTTEAGGANGGGTVFTMTPTGAVTTLYSFCAQENSNGYCTDGGQPYTGLVRATDGKFYGTTVYGGANNSGTIFSITPAGKLTSFSYPPGCADCSVSGSLVNPLVQAADGNFYGTTYYGGAGTESAGYGTVFEVTPAGKLTTLYSFCSQPSCTDGQNPFAGLIQATDGNFYGTTEQGGANVNCGDDGLLYCGTIFEITPLGVLTTLYSFCSQPNCADGELPIAELVQGTDGSLYGTTDWGGGSANCEYGCGTVVSLSMGLAPFVETLPIARAVGGNVTILGNNLAGTTSVTFNGTAATFTVASNTAIKTTVPTGATAGPVVVVTPSGTLTSNVPFLVEP
jgi:uncharacterized repeat protein (TIGR03803 family)